MDSFVADFGDNSLDKVDALSKAMDSFDSSFETIKIPVTSASMMLYAGYRTIKDKKSFSKLVDIVNEFLNGYENNEEYKQYVQSGTSSSENVRGRFDWWRDKVKTL